MNKPRQRCDGWTPERRAAFLAHLRVHWSVRGAAESVGMSRETAYRLRRKPENAAFAAEWDAALIPEPCDFSDFDFDRGFGDLHEARLLAARGQRDGYFSDRWLMRQLSSPRYREFW